MATTFAAPGRTRWTQLILGIIAMVMIANLQYGWTLFVNPIQDHFAWSKAAIQVTAPASGVLTVDSLEQALERAATTAGNKGGEAMASALEMAGLMARL